MTGNDAVEYLRQNGIHFVLEGALSSLLTQRPSDPYEFLSKYFDDQIYDPTSIRDRLTEQDFENRLTRIYPLFIGRPITLQEGTVYSALPLTDFVPPLHPYSLEEIADCLVYMSELSNKEIEVIVSIATRGAGALAHACAKKLGVKYTLCNWYPEGSDGEILVDAHTGFSGTGHVYLNSVTKGMKCLVLDDILRTGLTSRALIRAMIGAGAIPVAMMYAAEVSNLNGRKEFQEEFPNVPVKTLFSFTAEKEGTLTKADGSCRYTVGAPIPNLPIINSWMPQYSREEIKQKLNRVLEAFVNIPIHNSPQGYPYSNFCLTDFVPLMSVSYVEDCADCCVTLARKYFDECEIIVSESDRGGGPLTHACALRTNKPFCLANWYSAGTDVSFGTHASVGYSGEGRIFVNGVQPGTKVVVVDDMLSSGGTAEALFQVIEDAGGKILAGVFASEKANLKGRERLKKKFAYVPIITLCTFVSQGTATVAGVQPDFDSLLPAL